MKDISASTFDESTNTANKSDANDSKLPYVSPSPGEFPIVGSTICVDLYNPTREEFVKARECGFSAGSSQVHYNKNEAEISSNDLTAKFKPAMLNTGVNLIVSNDSIIGSYDTKDYKYPFDDPSVAASYKIRMNYTIQQSFVTGISVLDEPGWDSLVASGNPLKGSYTPGPKTKIYRHSRDVMTAGCTAMNLPKRQMRTNLKQAKRKKDEPINPVFGPLENYYEYLRAVQVLIQPQCWSFDLYPATLGPKGEHGYAGNLVSYYNYLDRFLQISHETNRPFRTFCLTTEFENGEGFYQATPTVNRLRYQTFVALAYGAQEIQYWTYCQRSHSDHPKAEEGETHEQTIIKTEFYISSPINRLGDRNQIWYSLQQVNEEIHRFSSVFRGCRVQHIKQYGNDYIPALINEMPEGEKPYFLESFNDSPITDIKVTGSDIDTYPEIILKGVMASFITTDPNDMSTGYVYNDDSHNKVDRTERYAVIMNRDPDNYKTVAITFDDKYEIEELTPRILTGNLDPSSRTIVRDLVPGGYLIFRYRKLS